MRLVDQRSDAQVVQAVVAGDTEAFALLVDRYQQRVFNLVSRMVGNRTDAEDVAQEVFCKLFQNLHRYDAAMPLENWLMRIAGNHTLNWLEKKRLVTTPIEQETENGEKRTLHLMDRTPLPVETLERREAGARILAALRKLPGTYRLVFILKYLDDYTSEEIADIVGTPRNTVKTWILRAREALRHEMEHHQQPERKRV